METIDRDPCGGPEPPERNRYFTGKFLSEQDFQAEQAYFVAKDKRQGGCRGLYPGLQLPVRLLSQRRAHPS